MYRGATREGVNMRYVNFSHFSVLGDTEAKVITLSKYSDPI
jgi:hypothetical protein